MSSGLILLRHFFSVCKIAHRNWVSGTCLYFFMYSSTLFARYLCNNQSMLHIRASSCRCTFLNTVERWLLFKKRSMNPLRYSKRASFSIPGDKLTAQQQQHDNLFDRACHWDVSVGHRCPDQRNSLNCVSIVLLRIAAMSLGTFEFVCRSRQVSFGWITHNATIIVATEFCCVVGIL